MQRLECCHHLRHGPCSNGGGLKVRCGLVALVALAACTAGAQSLTGVIAGVVRDAQGLPLAGALVALEGRAGTARMTADLEGSYQFPAVEPGPYSVRAEASGFRPQRREGVAIHAGAQLIVDFLLAASRGPPRRSCTRK